MKLRTVIQIYEELNKRNFGDVLEIPCILFSRSRSVDGYYDVNSMAFNLTDVKGFNAVKELIYHEMIHQYIHEFLKLKTVPDHGKEFKKTYCKFHTFDFDFDFNYGI